MKLLPLPLSLPTPLPPPPVPRFANWRDPITCSVRSLWVGIVINVFSLKVPDKPSSSVRMMPKEVQWHFGSLLSHSQPRRSSISPKARSWHHLPMKLAIAHQLIVFLFSDSKMFPRKNSTSTSIFSQRFLTSAMADFKPFTAYIVDACRMNSFPSFVLCAHVWPFRREFQFAKISLFPIPYSIYTDPVLFVQFCLSLGYTVCIQVCYMNVSLLGWSESNHIFEAEFM